MWMKKHGRNERLQNDAYINLLLPYQSILSKQCSRKNNTHIIHFYYFDMCRFGWYIFVKFSIFFFITTHSCCSHTFSVKDVVLFLLVMLSLLDVLFLLQGFLSVFVYYSPLLIKDKENRECCAFLDEKQGELWVH